MYNTFSFFVVVFLNHMDHYSARTTSHIQNKATALHERNTEFTCVGRNASPWVRGDKESKGANRLRSKRLRIELVTRP